MSNHTKSIPKGGVFSSSEGGKDKVGKVGLLSRDDAVRTGRGYRLKSNEKVESRGGVPRSARGGVRACV